LAIVSAGPWLLGIVINPSTGMTSLRIEVGLDAPGSPEDAIITPERLRAGATPQELTEAIWVAAEMRAGGAYAHSTLMLNSVAEEEAKRKVRSTG
jgi:hypothetical protein